MLGSLQIVALEELYAAVQHAQAQAAAATAAAEAAARAALPPPEPDEAAKVIWVQTGPLRDSHLKVAALFKEVQGEVRICDPYYGMGSLLRLDALVHCKSIRFLTLRPDSQEQIIIKKALS